MAKPQQVWVEGKWTSSGYKPGHWEYVQTGTGAGQIRPHLDGSAIGTRQTWVGGENGRPGSWQTQWDDSNATDAWKQTDAGKGIMEGVNKLGGMFKRSSTPTQSGPGAAATATPTTTVTHKGSLSDPGFGEDFFTKNRSKWEQPGESQNYWNGVKGYYTGPTTDEETRNSGRAREYDKPGEYENWYGAHQNEINSVGSGERALEGLIGSYDKPGQVEDYWGQVQNQFMAPGALERMWEEQKGKFSGPGMLEQRMGDVETDLNDTRRMGAAYDRARGDLDRHGYTERLADDYRPEASFSEQFYTGGGAGQGLEALYSRLEEKAAKGLDDRAAAGGSFNSGAALRARQELQKDLIAQQVKDYQAAANQADQAKMARLGYGLNLMTGADTAQRGRIGLSFQGAEGADRVALDRAAGRQNLYKDVTEEQRSGAERGSKLATDAQSAMLERLTKGGNLADDAQSAWLARMAGKGGAARDYEAARDGRFTRGSDAAGNAQDAREKRIKGGADLDALVQDMREKRRGQGADFAASASNELQGMLSGGQTAANSAQNLRQGRLRGEFDDAFTLAKSKIETFISSMDSARQEQARAAMTEIEGMLASGKIDSAEAQSKMSVLMQQLSMPLAVAGLPKTNPSEKTRAPIGGAG